MLRRDRRLKKNSQFKAVYANGRGYSNQLMVLRFMYLSHEQRTQIGFSVSKKIGGAVVRNYVKRRMAAAVYTYIDQIKDGFYLVLIARSSITDASFSQIKGAVTQLLNRARLI